MLEYLAIMFGLGSVVLSGGIVAVLTRATLWEHRHNH